jgi:zinc transporter 7
MTIIHLGFASFFCMEKTLRVLGGDEPAGHSHSHSHSHSHTPENPDGGANAQQASGVSTSMTQNGLRSRTSDKSNGADHPKGEAPTVSSTSPSKLSAYLNLFGDFVHNMSAAPANFIISFDLTF